MKYAKNKKNIRKKTQRNLHINVVKEEKLALMYEDNRKGISPHTPYMD